MARFNEKEMNETEEIGGACSERDQREHVWTSVGQGPPSLFQERPTGPQNDRCAQPELNPERRPLPDSADDLLQSRHHLAHRKQENRKRQKCSDPESPSQIV